MSALDSLSRYTTIPSYLLLALTFIYGYFRPKEYTEWLVVSSTTYIVSMALMMFIAALCFGIGLFLPDILATMSIGSAVYMLVLGGPSLLIFLYMFLYIMKSKIKTSGGFWQVSYILYIYATAQELFTLVRASIPTGSLVDIDPTTLPGFWLLLWYIGGAFIVILGGSALGAYIDKKFASRSALHIPTMKEKFGPKAPEELKFSDGSSAKGDYGPGFCVSSGVIYSLWMVLRHIILP